MADIDVVPKRTTHAWLWIIVAIVLALIVLAWLGVFTVDQANRVGQSVNDAFVAGAVAAAVT